MILFINVFVTDHRAMGFKYDRYGLPGANRLDIFKYALASLAALNKHWSKVIIYCQLDHRYAPQWSYFEAYIKGFFGEKKLSLYKYRLCRQAQWKEAYERDIEPISDNLIWYSGNDDHIFIDYDLNQIDAILEKMYNDRTQFISCIYSHWPEYIRFGAESGAWNNGCCAVYTSFNHDAIHIVSKALFRQWWYGFTWKGTELTRTDFIKFHVKLGTKLYVPYRELVRHFDGYSHSMHIPHTCPPLHIPAGFFRRNIRIKYGAMGVEPGYTTLNPLLPYRTIGKHGVDCRYMEEDIPLFWRDRISEFHVVKEVPRGLAIRARNLERHWLLVPQSLAGRKIPVLPEAWMEHWLYRKLDQPTLG